MVNPRSQAFRVKLFWFSDDGFLAGFLQSVQINRLGVSFSRRSSPLFLFDNLRRNTRRKQRVNGSFLPLVPQSQLTENLPDNSRPDIPK
jgi:hypothetical protein